MAEEARAELETGRIRPDGFPKLRERIDALRADLAAAVGNGGADEALEGLKKAIRPGVKAVVVSHVLYTTGAVLPLKEISELAHAAGATVIVDGAQSVGAIAVDAPALGADAYAFSGQKWLLGPEST